MSVLRAIIGATTRERRWGNDSVIPSAGSYYGYEGGRSITQDEAVRIAAIQSCVSLLGDTIGTLPTAAFARRGPTRVELDVQPTWLTFPIPSDPNATWEDHVSQLVWSQELDGNSFTLVLPSVFDAAELYVVNPQRTTVRKRGVFRLAMDGGGQEEVGPDQMIHVARNRRPGDLRGFPPAEEAGTTYAMKRAAEVFGLRVFRQGVFLSGQLLLPGPIDKPKLEQLKEEIDQQYGGSFNAGKPAVFANGAKWDIPQLDLASWQLVELHKAAKLEAAGMWRVPPYLLGVTDPGAMAYNSVEAQGTDFAKFSITPRTIKVERAYKRLLPDPEAFIKMSVAGLMRGDLKSRAEVETMYLQNKVMTVDEVRALEDLPPFGGAEGGLLETPNNNAPDGPPSEESEPPIGRSTNIAVLSQMTRS